MGKHVYDVSFNSVGYLLKTTFVHSTVYFTLSFFIKLSILLFYLRVYPSPFIAVRYTVYLFIFLLFAYTIAAVLILSFLCHPVEAFWTLVMRVGDDCPSQEEFERKYTTILAIHVTCDFLVLMLPIPSVWRLPLPRKQKALLVAIFCAGGLACMASIFRLVYFPAINQSLDITRNVTRVVFWGQVEAFLAVVCASLPSLKPLFTGLKRKDNSVKHSATTDSQSMGDGLLLPGGGLVRREGLCTIHSRTASTVSARSGLGSPKHRSLVWEGGSPRASRRVFDPYASSLAEIDNLDLNLEVGDVGVELLLATIEKERVIGGEGNGSGKRLVDEEGQTYIDKHGRLTPVPPPTPVSPPSSRATNSSTPPKSPLPSYISPESCSARSSSHRNSYPSYTKFPDLREKAKLISPPPPPTPPTPIPMINITHPSSAGSSPESSASYFSPILGRGEGVDGSRGDQRPSSATLESRKKDDGAWVRTPRRHFSI